MQKELADVSNNQPLSVFESAIVKSKAPGFSRMYLSSPSNSPKSVGLSNPQVLTMVRMFGNVSLPIKLIWCVMFGNANVPQGHSETPSTTHACWCVAIQMHGMQNEDGSAELMVGRIDESLPTTGEIR
jgi:hypothetical protein